MAYAVIVEIPGGTLEQYDAMTAAMGFEGEVGTSHSLSPESPATGCLSSTSGSREKRTSVTSPLWATEHVKPSEESAYRLTPTESSTCIKL